MKISMKKIAILGALTVSSFTVFVSATQAAQPTYPTPAGQLPLPNIIYVIPYAISTGTGNTAPNSAETIITINTKTSAAGLAGCDYQVEWVNYDGTIAGYSGPDGVAGHVMPNGSLEYTTVKAPAAFLAYPFQQNVFSNLLGPFEGYANIRSKTCVGKAGLTGVDAEFVLLDANGIPQAYRQIEPVVKAGNAGE